MLKQPPYDPRHADYLDSYIIDVFADELNTSDDFFINKKELRGDIYLYAQTVAHIAAKEGRLDILDELDTYAFIYPGSSDFYKQRHNLAKEGINYGG